jgi:hypothetical protein
MVGGIKDLNELKKEMLQHDEQLSKQVSIDGENLIINVEYE